MPVLAQRRSWLAGFVLFACVSSSPLGFSIFDPNRPELHEDILEHFKYGSIGAEERAGIPYWIWLVLPGMFPEHLPDRPGEGYGRFGFVFEPGKQRPIGTSRRERQVPLVGLNCAACHTGTVRDRPGGAARVVLGMPSHQFDLQSYQRFLFACIRDSRFTPENVWAAMLKQNSHFSWFDGITYRWFVIPRTKREGMRLAGDFSWFDSRPPQGSGRVDTFNPYKVMFGFDMASDRHIGSADLPSLWNQKLREGMWLHWDGNNNSVTERNKSAAIGAGCSQESLDLDSMKRVEDWIWTLPAPQFPRDRIDTKRAAAGAQIYKTACSGCHEPGEDRTGQVVALQDIGTDPERLNSFTPALVEKMNTLGTGRPWKFTHFRKTEGYAAMPLDGVWLRAPYLHNGSVPTLRHLLETPEHRPQVFWRGYDVYDYSNAGFLWSGPEAERAGFRYDTSVPGNSRAGHLYGTDLAPGHKENLLEFLKTL
jgi:mono/diheme cytochrome c family protein